MDLVPVDLSAQDVVLSVFESSPGYFMSVEGCSPSMTTVQEAILGKPKNPVPQYQKEFLLIKDEHGDAIGTLELHINHPESEIAYIGLLLIREDLAGKGLGRACYQAAENYIRETYGSRLVRLGVSDDNDVSGFWSKLGFRSNGRSYSWEGERKASNVVEYEKLI